jgi:hypothetical protein
VTAEVNIHLEDNVFTKTVHVSFTNPTCTVGLQLLNLRLLKAMLRCVWCNDHEIWTSDNWKRVVRSDEPPFTLFPTSERVYVWRTHKEAYNPECLVPKVKHGGGFMMIWAALS